MADDNESDPRPWLCPGGHILGYVVRRNGIRRLVVDWGTLHIELTGTAEIVCGCKKSRTWFAPEEGMEELLERRAERFHT